MARYAPALSPLVLKALHHEARRRGMPMHLAFARDREPTELDLGEVLAQSVPLAVTMSEPIDRLRHWSQGRARQATSATPPPTARRKIDAA